VQDTLYCFALHCTILYVLRCAVIIVYLFDDILDTHRAISSPAFLHTHFRTSPTHCGPGSALTAVMACCSPASLPAHASF
jgi:hypothetical protein